MRFTAFAVLVVLLVVAACLFTSNSRPPLGLDDATFVSPAQFLPEAPSVTEAAGTPRDIPYQARKLIPPKVCKAAGGVLPYIVVGKPPVLGTRLEVRYWLHGLTAPGAGPDNRHAWVILADRRLQTPVDFSPWGMPDCHLLLPTHQQTVVAFPGGRLIQYGGYMWRDAGSDFITFHWDIPDNPNLAGFDFYTQLVVQDASENPGGFVVSIGYKFRVGWHPDTVHQWMVDNR